MIIFQKLAGFVIAGAMALGLVGGAVPQEQMVGAALPQQDALVDTFLASGISTTDTTMTLADGTTRDGETLMGYYCFTVDINTPTLEYICGTASSTTVTGLERGIKMSNPTATSTALAFSHRRFATVQVTDFPFNQLVQRKLNGTDGFSAPLFYDGVSTATVALSDDNFASVGYANSLAFGAIPAASETAAGFVELATQTEAASSTSSGSAARLVIGANLSTSTAPASGNYVPVSESDGNIAQGWIDLTENFAFTGTVSVAGRNVVGQQDTLVAGENLTGATTPQPVYASTTDSRVYLADANDAQKLKFSGFAVNTVSTAGSATVQVSGIVGGFSGLTTGATYYLSDTVGTISTTPGTWSVLVGQAISATEVQIQKGGRVLSGAFSLTNGGGTTAVVLGFRPTRIRLNTQKFTSGSIALADGTWTTGGFIAISSFHDEATAGETISGSTLRAYDNQTADYYGTTVTNVTDTGFTITWSETGTPSNTVLGYWEATGDI